MSEVWWVHLKGGIRHHFKGYLCYKTITSQNVSFEAQVNNFFYFVEKLCSVLKILKVFVFLTIT